MNALETWEMLSYVVTVVGLPFAIAVFAWERRRDRENDEAEVFQRLSDEYAGFLKLCLGNADLQLRSTRIPQLLTPEQEERKLVLFDILISLFERAYLLVYQERMDSRQARLWKSWEDYMREWCRRTDFRSQLTELLAGEDPEFAAYIRRLAAEEVQRTAGATGT